MEEERKVYKVLVGKPEGKRPLERPRRRWEDGIRMDLREIGLVGGRCGLVSTVSGQGPVAGCCECCAEPSGSCAMELVSLFIHFISATNSVPMSAKSNEEPIKPKLSNLQRLAYLGGMKMAPTAAIEVLLRIPPL
jgi:hypothetical protein